MNFTEQINTMLARISAVEGYPESPDILAILALARGMEHIHQEEGSSGALLRGQDDNGGLGVMAAALDFAWAFECEACLRVEWTQNAEVWTYWVEDKAEDILKLMGWADEPDEAFREKVHVWLGEQPEITLRDV